MAFFKNMIKKKTSERDRFSALGAPSRVSTLSAELQMKYAKGVQYNMKVVIKGDRNVGKSTLFKRLQGGKFSDAYKPTNEIQVANIQWNYKATDDVVKVEIWDVVDQGRRKSGDTNQLKLSHKAQDEPTPCLDASFVDVYKGAHAVIIMYDITKSWTWSYVENEIPNIPSHLPVIILANNRDMGQHRTVELDAMKYFVSSLSRGNGAAPVRFAESSMKNGFGLKFLHTFFNVPFLTLQRNTLLKQLEDNARETETLDQELDLMIESDDFNYDLCLERQQTKAATFPSKSGQAPSHTGNNKGTSPRGPSSPSAPLADMSSTSLNSPFLPPPNRASLQPGAVDEFQPDQMEDKSFFEDVSIATTRAQIHTQPGEDSDTDSEGDGNPMVAGFQDDLESEDEVIAPVAARPIASADVQLSSDEEEEGIPSPEQSSESEGENLVEKLRKLNFSLPEPAQEKPHHGESSSQVKSAAHFPSDSDDDEVPRPAVLGFDDLSSEEEPVKLKVVESPSAITVKDKVESEPRKKKKTKTPEETGDPVEKTKKKKTKKSTTEGKKKIKSSKVKESSKPIDPLEAFLNDDVSSKSKGYENL